MNQRRGAASLRSLAVTVVALLIAHLPAPAQEDGHEEMLPFAAMDHWVVRHIKESAVIGGHTKTLYEVGPDRTIEGNEPYNDYKGSPWATSNVLARVAGITKTNVSVTRDRRGSGYCARLETHIEKVKVLGLVNISVIAAGALYLGDMKEPITSTKDGPKSQHAGIPFTRRPRALRFDYRTTLPGTPDRIKLTGFSGRSTVAGADQASVELFLQRRQEHSDGSITAERVGTVIVRYKKSTDAWVTAATYEIRYGDLRQQADYDDRTMGLRQDMWALNSRGKSVPVREIGWAAPTATPTHLCLSFASSHGGAYIGTPGNTLWVDNVRLVY